MDSFLKKWMNLNVVIIGIAAHMFIYGGIAHHEQDVIVEEEEVKGEIESGTLGQFYDKGRTIIGSDTEAGIIGSDRCDCWSEGDAYLCHCELSSDRGSQMPPIIRPMMPMMIPSKPR